MENKNRKVTLFRVAVLLSDDAGAYCRISRCQGRARSCGAAGDLCASSVTEECRRVLIGPRGMLLPGRGAQTLRATPRPVLRRALARV